MPPKLATYNAEMGPAELEILTYGNPSYLRLRRARRLLVAEEVAFGILEWRDMSAIASFYIFDKSALESLISKPIAAPQKAGLLKSLFGSKESSPQKLFVDEFYAVGREVAVFEFSGYAFPSLELFLEERYGIEVNSQIEPDLTGRLADNIGPCHAFEATGAAGLLQKLSSISVSRSDLQEYADEEHGEDQGVMVEALESAFNSLKSWLAQIHPGQIGILINS